MGAWGVGSEALAAQLRDIDVAPTEIDRAGGFHRPHGARTAWLAAGVDLSALLPGNQARRMSPPARLALAATRLALDEAGLPTGRDPQAHARTAVVLGTAYGPASVTEQLLRQILLHGPETASPAAFAESVASASAAQIALATGARGPNLAITQRQASDLLALGEAARLLATGAAARVIGVMVDELIPLLHALLDRFGMLARAGADGRERARPFDRERRGTLAAEGATALVLEPVEAITSRGRAPLALLAGVVRGFDPSAPAWGWGGDATGLAATLRRGLERQDIAPSDCDRIVSGATGSPAGDRLEAGVLRSLFGETPPAVWAPKGAVGEAGGGHLAAAVLAAAGRIAAPTHGFEQPDPELALVPDRSGQLPAPRRLLVSALAPGGAAAWAVLDRPR